MNIDPGVVTLVQTTFLQHTTAAFAVVTRYALNLLYLFAVLEMVLFGLGWALQHDAGWGKLFFKVIKIGLIFTIIQNYPDLVSAIINSFSTIAGVVVNRAKIDALIFNPAQIWQYGYDFGLFLLQNATGAGSMGLALILTTLGMGVLLVFALLGIQVVVQLVGFYFVALVGLILLPLGIFEPSRRMFDRSVQAVLQAGVRVMTVIIVIGIAAVVWDGFKLSEMGETIVSLNQSLGLFFSALLFLFLAIYLPRLATTVVGEIRGLQIFTGAVGGEGAAAAGAGSPFATPAAAGGGEMAGIQAATTLESAAVGTGWQGAAGAATAVEVSGAAGFAGASGSGSGGGKTDLIPGSILAKGDAGRGAGATAGISPQTLKKLKEVLAKISE